MWLRYERQVLLIQRYWRAAKERERRKAVSRELQEGEQHSLKTVVRHLHLLQVVICATCVLR